ncbi:MAG TPA: hypothetical protein VFH45_00025, partial [Acidimicrobiales bacterium]|nr:hypothetical protein [Acidimicrobiales bacterium]
MTMPIRAAALLTGVALLAAACAGGGHTGAPRSPAPGAAVGARRAPDAPAGPRARAEHHVWALAAGAPTVAPTPARAAPFVSPV